MPTINFHTPANDFSFVAERGVDSPGDRGYSKLDALHSIDFYRVDDKTWHCSFVLASARAHSFTLNSETGSPQEKLHFFALSKIGPTDKSEAIDTMVKVVYPRMIVATPSEETLPENPSPERSPTQVLTLDAKALQRRNISELRAVEAEKSEICRKTPALRDLEASISFDTFISMGAKLHRARIELNHELAASSRDIEQQKSLCQNTVSELVATSVSSSLSSLERLNAALLRKRTNDERKSAVHRGKQEIFLALRTLLPENQVVAIEEKFKTHFTISIALLDITQSLQEYHQKMRGVNNYFGKSPLKHIFTRYQSLCVHASGLRADIEAFNRAHPQSTPLSAASASAGSATPTVRRTSRDGF